MKKINNRLFSILSAIIILPILIWYLTSQDNLLSTIQRFSWVNIIYLIIFHNIFIVLMGYLNKRLINKIGYQISIVDSVELQYVNNLFNKIIPKGGGAFRAMYLKRVIDFPYTQFLTTISGYYVVQIASQSLVGLFCLSYIFLESEIFNWVLTGTYGLLLFGSLGIMAFKFNFQFGDRKLFSYLSRMVDGWQKINDNLLDIFVFILISILGLLTRAIQLFIIFQGMQLDISLVSVLFLASLSIILMFINITPDGIGVREGLYLFSGLTVGNAGADMVLVSLILRVAELISALVMGLISYFLLLFKLNKTEKIVK